MIYGWNSSSIQNIVVKLLRHEVMVLILRIKEIRESGKISQTALAEKLHVNQTAVSQWERGVAYPTCDRLPEIAKALGCEISEPFRKKSM